MIKYFINYTKYKKLFSEDKIENRAYIFRRYDDDNYKVYSVDNFKDDKIDIMKIDKFTSMIMIELTSNELDKVKEKDIEKFEETENGYLKKFYYRYEVDDITLINFSAFVNMNVYDTELGNLVKVTKNSDGSLYITDRIDEFTYGDRNKLQSTGLGCDIYFYTENEDLLNKYKESTTTLKNTDINKYKLDEHKLIIIDSLSQDRVYDFTNETYKRFIELTSNSIKVSISEEDELYSIKLLEGFNTSHKKGYIISNSNFSNMLYDPSMAPLLKYINIYELNNGNYKKTTIKDYLGEKANIINYKNQNYKRTIKKDAA